MTGKPGEGRAGQRRPDQVPFGMRSRGARVTMAPPVAGERLRLFVAIELEPAMLEELARLQETVRSITPRLRFTRPEGIHCTLKFLGNVDADRLPAVRRSLASLVGEAAPGRIRLGGLGVFPPRGRARVVWCGLEGDTRGLRRLAEAVDREMAPAGFGREPRPYTPHLTLARVPEGVDPGDLGQQLLSLKSPQPVSMRPLEFSLVQSKIARGGALYTPVESYALRVD